MELISMQGVTKIYRTKEIETVALEGVNLDVHEGEFLSVMGPSGCGKSTMLNIMGLLDVPTEGKVIISEQQTQQMNDGAMAEFRNRMLGFVFQSFHLVHSLNVLDNVELPEMLGKRATRTGNVRTRKSRPLPPDKTLSVAALRRTMPARSHRTGFGGRTQDSAGRRADRKPRQ